MKLPSTTSLPEDALTGKIPDLAAAAVKRAILETTGGVVWADSRGTILFRIYPSLR